MQGSTVFKIIAAVAVLVFILAFALMVYRSAGAALNWQIGGADPVQAFYPAKDGLYVIGSSNVSFINASGKALWTLGFPGVRYSAYGNDTLYVYSDDRGLNAIARDGAISTLTRQELNYSPTVGPDGTLYLRSGGLLSALGPAGGEKWNASNVISDPVADGRGNVYFFRHPSDHASDVYLYSLAPDGSLRWSTLYDRNYASTKLKPASKEGVFVYDEPAGVLYDVDGTGNIRWDHTMAYLGQYDLVVDEKDRLYMFFVWGTVHVVAEQGNLIAKFNPVMAYNANLSYTPAAYNDTIYVVGDTGKDSAMLYALDLDGTLRWKQPFNSSGSPAIYPGRGIVCVGTEAMSGGQRTPVLYVIDALKGELKLKYNPGDGTGWAQVYVDDSDTIYARTYGGQLYALKG